MIIHSRLFAQALTSSRTSASFLAAAALVALIGAGTDAGAAGPTVKFALPVENAMPSPFGSVPFPSDLYFDQGGKGDGDGTLLNAGDSIGIVTVANNANYTPTVERGLDTLDGWGVSTGCQVFFTGAVDGASLPLSPVVAPTTADSVFLMNLSDGSLVPVKIVNDADTRIANTLSIVPVAGNVLRPATTYACVVTTAVAGGGMPVVASTDFIAARSRASANGDANDIHGDAIDAVVAFSSLAAADVAGMAVFTTQDPDADLVAIQTTVLPGLALPAADFTFASHDLIFDTPADLDALLGFVPHASVGIVATGYFQTPRFQTNDPNGNGKTEDLPDLGNLAAPCQIACEPDDERFVDVAPADGLPDVQGTPRIPFTVVIPNTPAPGGGYPIVIDQHGLGGERSLVALLGNALAERGFASIGIEAVGHGYRFHDPNGTNTNNGNNADVRNNFPGGTIKPDGFADNGFFGVPLGAISTQLGFFQGFTNLVGVRDNFRQTCVDLMSLVRLIQSNTIDSALGAAIDEANIYYLGHSLGAIMGSCLAAYEPDIKAYVLNAPGGGLTNHLLVNSSIGAGALSSLNTIFGLDPANVLDDASIFVGVAQVLQDAGDPISKGPRWTLDPVVGGARNVMLVIDHQDEVVPNQAGEALAHAAGLELFRPYVANPLINPVAFPVVAGANTVSANGPGGSTAFVIQQGPAAHAATFFPDIPNLAVSSLGFVPDHALVAEWGVNGSGAFPPLERPIRIRNESILEASLDWLEDIVQNGAPGTFTFSPSQNPNPRENGALAGGAETATFFDRAVDGVPAAESTPNTVVDFASNSAAGRLTGSRSTLGPTDVGNNADMPPGVDLLASGMLPFFVSLQKNPAGAFTADVSVGYSTDELLAAGIAEGSAGEAGLSLVRTGGPGTCAFGQQLCTTSDDCVDGDVCVEVLSGSVDTGSNTVTATGLTSFSTFAVANLSTFTPALRVQGGGSTKKDCVAAFLVQNPAQFGDVDSKGRTSTKQTCTEGDASCDADSDPSQCTFRVGLCFRVVDPALPECPLTAFPNHTLSVEELNLRKPSEKDVLNPKKPKAGANRAALLAVVSDVLTLPQTATNNCAAFQIEVPLKDGTKKGKEKLKLIASGPLGDKKVKDADKLLLTCLP